MDVSEHALDPGLRMLNHASFGAPTRLLLEEAQSWRYRLEADAGNGLLADRGLVAELLEGGLQALVPLTVPGDLVCALTGGSSDGTSALAFSLPLGPGPVVVAADEYPSAVAAWSLRARRDGRDLVVLDRSGTDRLLSDPGSVLPGEVGTVLVSLVTSGTAELRSTTRLGTAVRARGGRLVVDAAHSVGLLPSGISGTGADALVASLHKWLPVPRSVGLLALVPELAPSVHPAVVGLEHDDPDLVRRFSWPGTPDLAARAVVPGAVSTWLRWEAEGRHAAAAALLAEAADEVTSAGALPLARTSPSRLRAWELPGVPVERLHDRMRSAGVVVQAGAGTTGAVLRLATNVWNDRSDLDAAVALVRGLLAR